MHLGPIKKTFILDDRAWLGSAHGTDSTETITLDLALFDKATHYPDGFILSGEPLAQNATTKLWGPYADAATDGRTTLVGHLYGRVEVVDGATRYGAAMLTHGKVRTAKCPHAPDANGRADVVGRIRYI